MIVSYAHRFIFIKTKKTAGTSIEIVLSSVCGPRDIITPISPQDEAIRQRLGFRGPQNYTLGNGIDLFNHFPARQLRDILGGTDVWKSFYSFCFERNPWDKVISWYFWERQFNPLLTFDDFMASGRFATVGTDGGYPLYTDDQGVMVNDVYRYEELEDALARFFACRNLGGVPELPRAKAEFRTDRRHYRDFLSAEHAEMIRRAFSREIALFGYEF